MDTNVDFLCIGMKLEKKPYWSQDDTKHEEQSLYYMRKNVNRSE
jgi:hypothetical protein